MDPATFKYKWPDWFGNDYPIHIEPGCGKAELSIGLARKYPERNFLAIDLKSDRLCRGADLALLNNLKNIAFLRMNAEKLEDAFPSNSISEIWLTFPDPFPRDRDEKHRLTNHLFLKRYQKVLKSGGVVNLKTDNDGLIEYTLETLKTLNIPIQIYSSDLHNEHPQEDIAQFLTSFEKKFLQRNKNIHLLRFEIPESIVFFREDSNQTVNSLHHS